MNKEFEELEARQLEDEINSNKTSYEKDKQGWVVFKGKRPKMKLRAYISGLATRLTRYNDKTYNQNRNEIIEYYDLDGLPGVNRYMSIKAAEMLAEIERDGVSE